MSNRKVPICDGEYYHVYNRGNSKQKIFLDEEDYMHFIKLLYISNTYKKYKFRDNIVDHNIDAFEFDRGETIVSIGAWVLMPNHFHFYITTSHQSDWWEKIERNRISEYMRKLLTAYTLYFNKKYNRTGGLFEGKFKSVHINNDNQAKYLFSYIHLNPIKLIQKDWKKNGIRNTKKALDFLGNYKWSSYQDYKGDNRIENTILDTKNFLQYFSSIKDFEKEILEWLKYKKEEIF
ncbi:hypothetical protein IT400_00980 [Candidatus Nomurabacteria bacterium]|nr:hypothetical protein [Candidatus Nomurabacteria bacterium]